MPYGALLLDFYGTLVREDEAVYAAIDEAICRASPLRPGLDTIAGEQFRLFSALCGQAHGEHFRTQKEIARQSTAHLYERWGLPPEEAEGVCVAVVEQCWRRPIAYADAAAFLARPPLPMCLVSNTDSDDLAIALENLGWTFGAVVTSESARSYKPRPEMFAAALTLVGVSAGEALHVGDSVSADVTGAIAAGIDVAWLNRTGRALPPGSPRPTYEIRSLSELAALLRE